MRGGGRRKGRRAPDDNDFGTPTTIKEVVFNFVVCNDIVIWKDLSSSLTYSGGLSSFDAVFDLH